MPHTTGSQNRLKHSNPNDSGGSDDNSSENNNRKSSSERQPLPTGQKHFVARSSHGHPKHFRNSSSSTRLNKMNRITPLHGLNDGGSITSKSPKSTSALVGSSSSNSIKFLRSKSTDNVLLQHPHEAMQRRATSQAMIRSSRSQTRMSRHVHHQHTQPLVGARSRDASVTGKRKSAGTKPVLQLDHDDSDDEHEDDRSGEDEGVRMEVTRRRLDNDEQALPHELIAKAQIESIERLKAEAAALGEAQAEKQSEGQTEAQIPPQSQSESQPQSESQSQPKPQSESQSQPKSQPQPQPQPQSQSQPQSQPQSQSQSQLQSQPQSQSQSQSQSQLQSQPQSQLPPHLPPQLSPHLPPQLSHHFSPPQPPQQPSLTHLKPPINTNHPKSDEEYEDTDADEEEHPPPPPAPPPPTDSFKPLLHPTNTPTPPQISTETVVAISATDSSSMSSIPFLAKNHPKHDYSEQSTEVVRSRFLDTNSSRSGDNTPYPVASWVNFQKVPVEDDEQQHSANAAHSSSAFTTRTQQKLWLQRQSIDHPPPSTSSVLLTTEQRRDFDRITKEFINVRKFQNPVAETIDRIRTHRQPTVSSVPLQNPKKRSEYNPADPYGSLSQSLPKRITSLSATTLNENNDFPTDEANINNTWKTVNTSTAASTANVGSVAYKLTKIWNEGWRDPDEPEPSHTLASPSIHSQAQQVQQQIAAAQRQLRPNGGIKLV